MLEKSEILDADGAARYLGIKKRALYILAPQGRIPGVRIGRQWRFRKDPLDVGTCRSPGRARRRQAIPRRLRARTPSRSSHPAPLRGRDPPRQVGTVLAPLPGGDEPVLSPGMR